MLDGPKPDAECAPPWLIVEYQYRRGHHGKPLKLIWYHGGKRPPHFSEAGFPRWGSGSLFIGTKGMLLADYGRFKFLPEKDFVGYELPAPSIPRSVGHHREWLDGIKENKATTCHFLYGAPLTETGLIGNVAFRTGETIEWNGKRGRARNSRTVTQLLEHRYRDGWRL